jgi:hypothetical protein
MVTQDSVAYCVMRAAQVTNGSAVKLVAKVGIQEYVTHFAMQVAEATAPLTELLKCSSMST